MRVLHVITGLGIGGAEQQLRLLLRHLPATCEVVTLTNPGPLAEAIRADGTPVTHLGMAGNRDLTALPRLTALIRAGRYDVVHTHLYRACVYGRLAARLAGVRTVVATEHSLGDTQIEGRPLTRATRGLYRATERLGVATLAVSATGARRLRAWGVPAARVHVVPNGIDPAAFRFTPAARARTRARLGLPPDAFAVGAVGRLVPAKSFDTLVRAVAATPGARLVLAGTGPERTALLRLAAALDAADRVQLVGPAQPPGLGVPELLAAADVFVSTAPEETFGIAMVEALAAGLPVLHAACPAVDDLPPWEAPGARRISGGAQELAAALAQEQQTAPRRLAVPPAVARYAITRTAEQVTAIYEAATRRTAHRHHPPAHRTAARQAAADGTAAPRTTGRPPLGHPAAAAAPAADHAADRATAAHQTAADRTTGDQPSGDHAATDRAGNFRAPGGRTRPNRTTDHRTATDRPAAHQAAASPASGPRTGAGQSPPDGTATTRTTDRPPLGHPAAAGPPAAGRTPDGHRGGQGPHARRAASGPPVGDESAAHRASAARMTARQAGAGLATTDQTSDHPAAARPATGPGTAAGTAAAAPPAADHAVDRPAVGRRAAVRRKT